MPNYKFNGKTGAYESDKVSRRAPGGPPVDVSMRQPTQSDGQMQRMDRPFGQAQITPKPHFPGDTPATYTGMQRDVPAGLATSPYMQEVQRLYAAGQQGGGRGGGGGGPKGPPVGLSGEFKGLTGEMTGHLTSFMDKPSPFGPGALAQRLNEINVGSGMVNQRALDDFQNRTGQGPGDPAYEKMKQDMAGQNAMQVNQAKNQMAQLDAQYGIDRMNTGMSAYAGLLETEKVSIATQFKNKELAIKRAGMAAAGRRNRFAQQMQLLGMMGSQERFQTGVYMESAKMDAGISKDFRDHNYNVTYNEKAMKLQRDLGMMAAKSGKKNLLGGILGTAIGGGIGFAIGGPGGAFKGATIGSGIG